MSGTWAPPLGHRHRNHGNRVLGVLGSPPHCLALFVPPPVHQLKPESPVDCPSPSLIPPAGTFCLPRVIPLDQEHRRLPFWLRSPGVCRHPPSLLSGCYQDPRWKNLFSFPGRFRDGNEPQPLNEFRVFHRPHPPQPFSLWFQNPDPLGFKQLPFFKSRSVV